MDFEVPLTACKMNARDDPRLSLQFQNNYKKVLEMKNCGKTETAISKFKKLLKLYNYEENKLETAIILEELSQLNFLSAKFETSLHQKEQSLSIARQVSFPSIESSIFVGIGKCYFKLGRMEDAEKAFLSQLDIAGKIGDDNRTAETYLALVELYTHRKFYMPEKALKYVRYCEEVLSTLSSSSSTFIPTSIYSIQALIIVSQNEYDVVAKHTHLYQAMTTARQVDESTLSTSTRAQVTLVLCKSKIHLALSELPEALQYAQQARDLAEKNPMLLAEVFELLSEVYFQQGDSQNGLDCLQKALVKFTVLNDVMKMYHVNLALALTHLRLLGVRSFQDDTRLQSVDGQKICNHIEEAMGLLSERMYHMTEDMHRIAFSDQISKCCQLLQIVYVCTSGYRIQNIMVSEQDRAISLILGISSSKSEEESRHPALEFIDRSLTEQGIFEVLRPLCSTAIMYTFMKTEVFEGFIISVLEPESGPFGIQSKIIPYRRVDLLALLSRLQGSIESKSRDIIVENRSTHQDGRNALEDDLTGVLYERETPGQLLESVLKELYDILIAPVEQLSRFLTYEKKSTGILIFPYSDLFRVPFPALITSRGGHLFEYQRVTLAPSVRLLAYLDGTQSSPETRQQMSPEFIVIGNPATPPESGLVSLPGAEKEAMNVADMFAGVQLLIGDMAKKDIVMSKMQTASFIHFACHGSWQESYLALAPAENIPISTDPRNKTAYCLYDREIIAMKLNVKLVVLSSCNSARGTVSGEGVLGLARSFIAAGTQAVLVALWQIPDDVTEVLMTEFYALFKNGSSASTSLGVAMELCKRKYNDPFYWGAFALIGADVFYNDANIRNWKQRYQTAQSIGF